MVFVVPNRRAGLVPVEKAGEYRDIALLRNDILAILERY
jgi:hypothetical protein